MVIFAVTLLSNRQCSNAESFVLVAAWVTNYTMCCPNQAPRCSHQCWNWHLKPTRLRHLHILAKCRRWKNQLIAGDFSVPLRKSHDIWCPIQIAQMTAAHNHRIITQHVVGAVENTTRSRQADKTWSVMQARKQRVVLGRIHNTAFWEVDRGGLITGHRVVGNEIYACMYVRARADNAWMGARRQSDWRT